MLKPRQKTKRTLIKPSLFLQKAFEFKRQRRANRYVDDAKEQAAARQQQASQLKRQSQAKQNAEEYNNQKTALRNLKISPQHNGNKLFNLKH